MCIFSSFFLILLFPHLIWAVLVCYYDAFYIHNISEVYAELLIFWQTWVGFQDTLSDGQRGRIVRYSLGFIERQGDFRSHKRKYDSVGTYLYKKVQFHATHKGMIHRINFQNSDVSDSPGLCKLQMEVNPPTPSSLRQNENHHGWGLLH